MDSIRREEREFKRNLKKLVTLIGFIALFSALYFFVYLKPSNDRDWEKGMEILPKISINGDKVMIKDLRDTQFEGSKTSSVQYLEKTVDLNNLEKAWFIFEPFKIKPFTNFNGIAHTYFVFDFKDQDPIAVSVEARREKGEKYDAWAGLLNQYELIYIWGTESDETVRRVVVENNPLYMYPLTISTDSAKKLFLELANTTHELESTPRFYNSLTNNCTNELAKIANKVKPDSVPNDKALIFPGYSPELLYKLGYIPNNIPLEELNKKYYISDTVRATYNQKDFSKKLREKLN